MRRSLLLAFASLALAAPLLAPPLLAQGAKTSSPFGTSVLALKPGQWIWDASVAPQGPIMVVINLKTQRAYVYRNGIRIGATTVSSGKPGKKTPTGIFQILQKNKDHKSNLYNSAPMPYMQRLTWDGIALHAGNLPGYPASHGCIRMPKEFSKHLFEVSNMGMTVVVHDEAAEPQTVADTAMLAPVTLQGTPDAGTSSLSSDEVSRWTPEASPTGPVTIVLSTGSKRIVVYRNGIEIGRSRIGVAAGFDIGTRAAQFAGRDAAGNAQWIYLALPGYSERKGQNVEQDAINQVKIPPQFYAQVRSVIGEGTTLLATDGGITGGTSGKELTVMASDK
ncbi:L,D-transpeptidase [Polymorphobacter glacialis]|uniref:L,D-transpeptidase n=1 Tax=Sandarakinorhabdus glacialis TaxID=1614636 RepID=A0A917E5C2_9SPHN|nr:L,D-transpeptidase [Polymorphobacter glacialis]GGE05987.1 L,D-transpeptidase [Polymorphobacter glacialis]